MQELPNQQIRFIRPGSVKSSAVLRRHGRRGMLRNLDTKLRQDQAEENLRKSRDRRTQWFSRLFYICCGVLFFGTGLYSILF